jgi:hypothetical protein
LSALDEARVAADAFSGDTGFNRDQARAVGHQTRQRALASAVSMNVGRVGNTPVHIHAG